MKQKPSSELLTYYKLNDIAYSVLSIFLRFECFYKPTKYVVETKLFKILLCKLIIAYKEKLFMFTYNLHFTTIMFCREGQIFKKYDSVKLDYEMKV